VKSEANELGLIPNHSEEIHHLPFEIIVNLDGGLRFVQHYAGAATKDLDVGAVIREMTDDPWRDFPFSSVVTEGWALQCLGFKWKIAGSFHFLFTPGTTYGS
jgi:hypothetical protein